MRNVRLPRGYRLRWQLERQELAGRCRAARRDHEILLTVQHIRHRRSGLRGRHIDGPHLRPGRLVVRTEHRTAHAGRRREKPRLARDHERLRDERANAAVRASGSRNCQTFQRRVVAHGVRRLSVGDLPDDLPFAEIDRRDASPRRLDERETLDCQPTAATPLASLSVAPPRPGPAAAGTAGTAGSTSRTAHDRPSLRRRPVPWRCPGCTPCPIARDRARARVPSPA